MKALICRECRDTVALVQHETRYCDCRKSSGAYLRDNLRVSVDGPCVIMAAGNRAVDNMLAGKYNSVQFYLVQEPSDKVLRAIIPDTDDKTTQESPYGTNPQQAPAVATS